MEYRNDKGKPVASNYYEGVLQLRNPTKEFVKKAKKLIEENKLIFIAKQVKVVNGTDLYLSSQKQMQVIARELHSKFGGEMKISSKLHTVNRQTSKKVFRLTILLRLPKFKVGDIVKTRGRFIKVKTMGKKVFGVDVDTGKKISVDYKYIS
jgi:nonsense-mediated mRNA decay protein 3